MTVISHSKVTANRALDRLTEGRNSTVLKWKREVEEVMALPTQRLRRSAAYQGKSGYSWLVDNVGLVSNWEHLTLGQRLKTVYKA